jgi:putative inorganic carbon (hco3(-)) transporter
MTTNRALAMSISDRSQAPAAKGSGARELAFKLYLLFVVSWFLHLPERVTALAALRVDLLLVVIITALVAASPDPDDTKLDRRVSRLIILLIAYSIISSPFVQWPGSVLRHGLPELIKALVFYYFTAKLATSERKLSQLLFVFVVCQTVRVLEPLYLHVTQGYWGGAAYLGDGESLERLSGAPDDVVNPNGLAAVIVSVLPFVHYLWGAKAIGGLAYLFLGPLYLYALVLTGSRSGLLGLAVAFLMIWWQSRRKLLLIMAAVVTIAVALPRLSPDHRDRYLSIVSINSQNAATARGRLDGVKADFAVAMRRPLLGHGLGTSLEANANFRGRPQPSHNLFTEVLQELGFAGLIVFLMLLASIARSVRQALHAFSLSSSASPLVLRLGHALRVWFAVSLLSSLFSYGLASYSWYFMAGLADVLNRFLAAPSPVGETHPLVVRTKSASTVLRPAAGLARMGSAGIRRASSQGIE